MPLELAPEYIDQPQAVSSYKVVSHLVMNDEQILIINFEKGYTNNGVFTKMSSGSIQLIEADFLATAFTPVVAGTLYENLKNVLYAKLMEKLGLGGTVV